MRKAYSYIRMSTEIQLQGDSRRRQLEASRDYATRESLELVDSIDGFSLEDIGVSGFKGYNTQKGILARFLEALQAGKIEKGSVLLIESLDRLSRDNVTDALTQFLGILKSGIDIVTLTDNQCYTEERINRDTGALFVSLGIMMRANEESEIKSKRITAVWKNKRAQAETKPMTKLAPAWLALSEDKSRFNVVDDKAEVVREIFDLCINSFGIFRIAKHLNDKKIPVFGSGKIWYRSYIIKILTNRAVLGEFQPHIRNMGKRQPQGMVIPNYYPQIVDEQTFYKANVALRQRATTQKGRKGEHFSNLLSGLVYCGACGSKMSLRNRGSTPKGGRTLCCSSQKEGGVSCGMPEWDLLEVEQALFRHLREVDYMALTNRDQSVPKALQNNLEALRLKQLQNEQASARIFDTLENEALTDAAKKRLVERLNSVAETIEETNRQTKLAEQELASANEERRVLDAAELNQALETIKEHDKDYLFRSTLNQLLRKTIERIVLHHKLNIFQPWDITEQGPEVKAFRNSARELLEMPFEAILKMPAFKKFVLNFNRRLLVKYRTGAVRHILYGGDASIYLHGSNSSLTGNTQL